MLGHPRLDGSSATLFAIGAHRVVVRDDLRGVAVSAAGPTIVAAAEVAGGWVFELGDGSFASSTTALGSLEPLEVDLPPPDRELSWLTRRHDPPRNHRGVLAVVRAERVFEVDLAGAREVDTPWPVTDVLALDRDERLVGLVGGGLLRGPWEALRPVPLAGPWRDGRAHLGRVADWVELDEASLAPRPERCLLRAEPHAARDAALLELFAYDLRDPREPDSEPTPIVGRRHMRLDGAEALVLAGSLLRRAADGTVSSTRLPILASESSTDRSVDGPERTCVLREGYDGGWWLTCRGALIRIGDDDRVLDYRRASQLPGVLGWWGPCDGPERPEPDHAEGAIACVMGPTGESHEVRLSGEPFARCGSTLYTAVPGRLRAHSLAGGEVREVRSDVRGSAACMPDGALVVTARERIAIWRDEIVERAAPFDGWLDASGRGELALSHGRHVAQSVDGGRTWRLVELETDDDLRCGARCEVVGVGGRRLLDALPTAEGVMPSARSLRTGPYAGRQRSIDVPPREPTLRCETSPTLAGVRVEGGRLVVVGEARHWRVPLRRYDSSIAPSRANVISFDGDEVVLDEGGSLTRIMLGRRARRVPLAIAAGGDVGACMGCGTWLSHIQAAPDAAGRLVVLTSMCETALVRYEGDGDVGDVRRFLPGATLAFHEGEAFAVFPMEPPATEARDAARRAIAYPLAVAAPPRLLSVPYPRRVCRDAERGEWSWHSPLDFHGDGVSGFAVLEISAHDVCISELRSEGQRLVAKEGRLEGAASTRSGWVHARCALVD